MIKINVSGINQELYWENRKRYLAKKYGMGPAYDKVMTSLFLPLYQVAGLTQGISNPLQEAYNDRDKSIQF